MIKPDRVLALRSDRTVFQCGDRCAKVFSRATSCVDVLQEARNLAAAGDAGASAPAFIEVARLGERWALVTEYVRGETLARRMVSDGSGGYDWLKALAEAQLELQSARSERFPPLKEALRRQVVGTALAESMRKALLGRLELLEDGEALCHCDLGPDNLLLAASGAVVAVDWDRACRGSADADAAATWLALDMGYGREAARTYLKGYCRISDSREDDILRWLPVMAASRLRGSVRRERDMLLKLIGETMKGGKGL